MCSEAILDLKPFQSRFIFVSVRRREKELNKLYEKIAREFPFLVQQGLYTPRGEKVRTYKLEDYLQRLFYSVKSIFDFIVLKVRGHLGL